MSKKFIVTKLFSEATGMNDATIVAYQAFMRAAFGEAPFAKIEFEVIEENEVSQVDRLLQSVRNEFAMHDQAATKKPDQESTDEQH